MTGSALREASAASQLPLSPSGVRRPPLLLAFGRPTLYLLLSVAASAVLVAPVLPFRAPPWAVILSTLFTLSRLVDFKHAVTAYNLGCLPPPSYPHRDPVLGTDWVIAAVKALKSNSLLEYFQSAHDKFGSTFSHNVLGSTAIMTSEPANLKAILQGSFEDWPIAGPRLAALANVLGSDSIFQSNGQHWHRARSMMRPAFVRDEIADLEAFEKHVGNLIERAKKEMRGEGEGALGDGNVDLQKLFYMMTMDSATDFLFGHCTDTLSKSTPDALAFNKAFEYALQVGANRGRLGPLAGIVPDKAFDDSLKTMHAFLDKYVREAMNDEKNKLSELRKRGYVFLPELLKAGAPIEYVRDQVLSLMLAGRDTTASALSALFWNLSRRPDVVAKLRDEIAGLRLDEQGGRMPTWQELKGMRYMQYCIKEVLRLYPPVPSNSRGANKDTILPVGGGPDGTYPIYVRKGTTCRWVPNSLHRRKDIWGEDADEFRPERWETLRPTWEYLPFSGGPRICIGQQFALTQISYATLRLLREFKSIEARDEKPMLQTISTTASLVNGVVVTMELA